MSWNGAAWTISAEFYTYFIFGFLALISFRRLYIFIIISILYILFYNDIFEFINSFLKIKLHLRFQGLFVIFFNWKSYVLYLRKDKI